MKKKHTKSIRVFPTKQVDVEGRERIIVQFGFIEIPSILMDITEYIPEKDIADFDNLIKPGEAIQSSAQLPKDDVLKIYDDYMLALGNYIIELEKTLENFESVLEQISKTKKEKKHDG